jgi:hypothetical protein
MKGKGTPVKGRAEVVDAILRTAWLMMLVVIP